MVMEAAEAEAEAEEAEAEVVGNDGKQMVMAENRRQQRCCWWTRGVALV
jgi:hypothetical protein